MMNNERPIAELSNVALLLGFTWAMRLFVDIANDSDPKFEKKLAEAIDDQLQDLSIHENQAMHEATTVIIALRRNLEGNRPFSEVEQMMLSSDARRDNQQKT